MSFPNSVTISDYHCTSLRRAASCWRSPFRWLPSARRSTRPGCRSSRAWLLLPLPDWKGFPRWRGCSPTTQLWSRVPPPTTMSTRTFFCSLNQFRNNFSILNLNFSSPVVFWLMIYLLHSFMTVVHRTLKSSAEYFKYSSLSQANTCDHEI